MRVMKVKRRRSFGCCFYRGLWLTVFRSWRNKEGERLADFGLDEDAEFYDEDDLPLSEIVRRRKTQQ